MQLDDLQIKPRLRHKWAAIDLGFKLAVLWWKPLFFSWVLVSIPIAIGASILAMNDYWWLGFLLLWWFKPLFDKLPLYIVSRKIFGETVSVREALRVTWRLWKQDGLWWMTLRRLSFTRSFDMPVSVLESLRGSDRRHRLTVLHANSSSAASMLTVVCFHIESFLATGAVFLAEILFPAQMSLTDYFWDSSVSTAVLELLLIYACMCLVAPFYTIAGFVLYLNRRVELEGWDIEIQFRKLLGREQDA